MHWGLTLFFFLFAYSQKYLTLICLEFVMYTSGVCVCYMLLVTLRMSGVLSVLSSAALLSSCRLMSVVSVMESVHLIFGFPLFQPPFIFPNIIVFSKEPCLLVMCLK